jgi:hypothetical protein
MNQTINPEMLFERDELSFLREEIKAKIARSMGWDYNNLTTEQLVHIYNSAEYKMPGMMKS